jgi:hypothetical protein
MPVFPSGSRARVGAGRSICRVASSASANDASPGDGSSTSNGSDNYKDDQEEHDDADDKLDDQLIDSFLRGDYDYEISDDAPSPHPGLMPANLVRECLRSLRSLHDPTPSHGAAVLQRFLLPLSRRERWGDFAAARSATASVSSSFTASDGDNDDDPWRTQIMRAALTPHLLARQIRSSSAFGCLLDWTEMDVMESDGPDGQHDRRDWMVGGTATATATPSVAHVDAVLRLEDRDANEKKRADEDAVRIRFTLRRIGGVWLIDTARRMRSALAEAPPFD